MRAFGEIFKDQRIAIGKTLREFCQENGFDPGNISKIERGQLHPQDEEKIREYAKCLKISEGSDLWIDFFDAASVESGKIPKNILDDKEVVDKLPIFFRTLQSDKVTREALLALIEKIKRA